MNEINGLQPSSSISNFLKFTGTKMKLFDIIHDCYAARWSMKGMFFIYRMKTAATSAVKTDE